MQGFLVLQVWLGAYIGRGLIIIFGIYGTLLCGFKLFTNYDTFFSMI